MGWSHRSNLDEMGPIQSNSTARIIFHTYSLKYFHVSIIGANLSIPHTSELNDAVFIYIRESVDSLCRIGVDV